MSGVEPEKESRTSWLAGLYRLAVWGRLGDDAGPFDPAQVQKILVVRNDNIGDVICTTPALDALRQAFPRARIAALVCTLTEEAIIGHRALDAVYAYHKAKHRHYGPWQSYWRLARVLRQIRRERFDLAVAFRASFSPSQGWLAFASRARWRLGPRPQGRRERWAFYYNLAVDPPPPGIHEVERCFYLLKHIRVDSETKRLYLKVPAAAQAAVQGFLAAHGLAGRPGPVVVNITRWAYRPDRLWPAEKYRRLVEALIERKEPVVVTHAPADQPWVSQLLADLRPWPAVFWSRSLKEFAALAERARVFVTAEGGPMHLAAAVGTPLVVLWGTTPLEVWRPWGGVQRILGAKGTVDDITVEEALEAISCIGSAESRPEN